MFEFLGALIGMSIRSGCLLNLDMDVTFWKHLTSEAVKVSDLYESDQNLCTMIE